MVFYIRLNFSILSNALQFGCIGNCCCLGLGYVSARRKETQEEEANEKREKSKKMSTRKSSSCRRVVFRHSAFPCSMLCMWHVVAYCCCCCCCPKTDFATVAAPPTLRCPQGTTAHHWPQLMERINSPSPCFSPLFSLSLLVVRKTSDPHLAVLSIKTAFLLSRWHFDTGCFS